MTKDVHSEKILIIDFGSQYTQLIARRVREIGVYCEIYPFDVSGEDIQNFAPNGIILSGGPETVLMENAPSAPQIVFELNIPVLGICYGMQTMAQQLGGSVVAEEKREFGAARVELHQHSALFTNIEDAVNEQGQALLDVWMSHGDRVETLPAGFVSVAKTSNSPHAGIGNEDKHYYGVQFHPEKSGQIGLQIIENFLSWSP